MLAGLDSTSGRLRCIYGSRSTELCDAENVLLYNVGLSTFSRLTSKALIFERSFNVPPCPVPLAGPSEHHHLYVVDSDDQFVSWSVSAVTASFGGKVPQRVDKVADWWWSARASIRDATGDDEEAKRFGLRIRLGRSSRRLIGLLKPMVDGIVAAFHIDPAPSEVAVIRLAAHLEMTPAAIAGALEQAPSPLGQRRLLWPYRDGVQWNPADELCVACHVDIDHRLPPDSYEGELLHVSERQTAT